MGNPQIVATQDTEQLRAKLHLTIFATFTLANLKSAKNSIRSTAGTAV